MTTTAHPHSQPANPVFDTRLVAYVFNQRGYRVNEFAARLDLSNDTVEGFLRGDVEVGDLRIATLANMANLLGIPLHSMFTQPPTPPDPDTLDAETTAEDDGNAVLPVGAPTNPPTGEPAANQGETSTSASVAADAEQLIATIYDNGRTSTTLISELAHAFNWTTTRTYQAATEATRRLKPAGLQATTSHGEISITPTNDHRTAHQALTQRHTYERGLTLIHYKAAHQMLTNQEVTITTTARQQLRTLGGLVNLGIVTDPRRPQLTEQAQEAFL